MSRYAQRKLLVLQNCDSQPGRRVATIRPRTLLPSRQKDGRNSGIQWMPTNPTNESRIGQLEHQMLFAPEVHRKDRRSASRKGRGFGGPPIIILIYTSKLPAPNSSNDLLVNYLYSTI
jgi:hypothetical protein